MTPRHVVWRQRKSVSGLREEYYARCAGRTLEVRVVQGLVIAEVEEVDVLGFRRRIAAQRYEGGEPAELLTRAKAWAVNQAQAVPA